MGREPLLKRPCGLQPFKDASKWSHSVLIPVSRSYSQLEGRLLTRSSPLRHCALLHRSTCMPNPCRQRSFWARIKLSVQKNYFVTDLSLSVLFFSLQKKLILEFIINSNFPDRTSTEFASPFNPDPGHSHYSIFQGTPDFHPLYFKLAPLKNERNNEFLI